MTEAAINQNEQPAEVKKPWRRIMDSVWSIIIAIVVAGILGAIGSVVGLQIADATREKDVNEIKASQSETTEAVKDLREDIQKLSDKAATKEHVEKAENRAVDNARKYTDQKVSELQPVLHVQTKILERIEDSQKDIRIEQRSMRDSITELKVEMRSNGR